MVEPSPQILASEEKSHQQVRDIIDYNQSTAMQKLSMKTI